MARSRNGRSDVAETQAPWEPILSAVYGPDIALRISPKVHEILEKHTSGTVKQASKWDETDLWVITYPDQFVEADRPPLESLRRFAGRHLRPWCNGLHILPFFPWSSDGGFSIKDYLAVATEYGSWSEVEALTSELRVIVDAVINHASVEGDWFRGWQRGDTSYRDFFRVSHPSLDLSVVVRAREHPLLTEFETHEGGKWVWTTFSADQADLNYQNPEVLLRVLEVLLSYCRRGLAVIRLDAVGFLWKEEGTPSIHLPQTHELVAFLRACLDVTYPEVILLTETNVPHAENVAYFGSHTVPEADAVYQFPLPPLTWHAFATGDASTVKAWLDSFDSPRPGSTFVNFLASHDGVGLRALEGWVTDSEVIRLVAIEEDRGAGVSRRTLPDGNSRPYEINSTWHDLIRGDLTGEDALARFHSSHALMLALQGIPAIYVHSLFASSNDVAGANASGHPRDLNRQRFNDVGALEAALASPGSRPARAFHRLKELAIWRRGSRAFHPDAPQIVLDTPPSVAGIERVGADGESARVYVNVTDEVVSLADEGATDVQGIRVEHDGARVQLGPWGSAWFLRR